MSSGLRRFESNYLMNLIILQILLSHVLNIEIFFLGLNCEVDINECDSQPCQNGGTCLEHSNRTLYEYSANHSLPEIFSHEFNYDEAFGCAFKFLNN